MNTLIIPCAGKSSRFPNMKPKYMLTHPDGSLMVEKALSSLNTEIFDRIIITIVKPHDEKYEAKLIMEQVFKDNTKVEICLLDDFTSSASETIFLTLEKMNVEGAFVIKDSDNAVFVDLPANISNMVVGYDLHIHKDVSNVVGKSFLVINEQNIIQEIIEKKIVSNIICLGVYCFESANDFKEAYKELLECAISGEMFVSHLISHMLSKNKYIFEAVFAYDYSDWGTLNEWQQVQKRSRTYFVDVDGVLMKNRGKYGSVNWYNNKDVLEENMKVIKKLQDDGAQIVITTARTEEFRLDLEAILEENQIKPYAILMGMNHATRVVINDFAPTNPYPSCLAVTLPRNSNLNDYFAS
ncbi:MAG: HAD hydrolase family protein [Opitutales bacterium]